MLDYGRARAGFKAEETERADFDKKNARRQAITAPAVR